MTNELKSQIEAAMTEWRAAVKAYAQTPCGSTLEPAAQAQAQAAENRLAALEAGAADHVLWTINRQTGNREVLAVGTATEMYRLYERKVGHRPDCKRSERTALADQYGILGTSETRHWARRNATKPASGE